MKTLSSTLKSFTFKALLIFTCATAGLSSFVTCHAQSIAGKWSRVSAKQFFTAEAAKTLGKSFVEVPTASAGSSVIEFKADHTYIKTLTGKYQPTPVITIGSWSASGNQFEMKMDANQPNLKNNPKKEAIGINTITISGNTLTVSSPVSADNPMSSQMKINKIEETYKRM